MDTADVDYDLPAEAIAQVPVEPRDAARLLVDEGVGRSPRHGHIPDLASLVGPGDVVVVNTTRPRVMVVRRQTDDPAYRELKHALRRRRVTFHHLHDALLTIEPELARMAAERADDADIGALRANLDAQHRALEDFAEWSRLDEEFHLTIAEMSANPALVIARTPITQLLLPTVHGFISSSRQTTHAVRYHERILAEIEAHDPDLAAAVMRRHIHDFRVAWEKAGLDFDQHIADLAAGRTARAVGLPTPVRAPAPRARARGYGRPGPA